MIIDVAKSVLEYAIAAIVRVIAAGDSTTTRGATAGRATAKVVATTTKIEATATEEVFGGEGGKTGHRELRASAAQGTARAEQLMQDIGLLLLSICRQTCCILRRHAVGIGRLDARLSWIIALLRQCAYQSL